MKIIHAVANENGTAHGGTPGDQTGEEIREAKWYNRDGGWEQYIECTDETLAKRAVTIAKAICDGNYGYNQSDRWSGYDAICNSGIEAGRGDFDCSSLVLSCYRLAGLNIKEKTGSTRDVASILTATGKFKLYKDEQHLTDGEYAKKGSLYCTPGKHVCMCIEDGEKAVTETVETGSETVETGSETEVTEVTINDCVRVKFGSVRIRETPKTGKTIAIAHEGDILETFGTDPETGWYQTTSGYITNNERYVEKC